MVITNKELYLSNTVTRLLFDDSYNFVREDDAISSAKMGMSLWHEETVDGAIKYGVNEIIVRPGVWTLANGDPGYPDEYEEKNISIHDNFVDALKALLSYYCNREVKNIILSEEATINSMQ